MIIRIIKWGFKNLCFFQAIPHKFVRKHGEALETEEVRLKVASGAEWKVGLTKNDEKIWFEKGWEEFVKFYSVEIGHFLTFRYEGNSCFHVVIFDKTASEIEYPLGCGGKVKKRERFSISEEATKFQSLTMNPSFMVTMGASYLHTGKSYLVMILLYVVCCYEIVGLIEFGCCCRVFHNGLQMPTWRVRRR